VNIQRVALYGALALLVISIAIFFVSSTKNNKQASETAEFEVYKNEREALMVELESEMDALQKQHAMENEVEDLVDIISRQMEETNILHKKHIEKLDMVDKKFSHLAEKWDVYISSKSEQ